MDRGTAIHLGKKYPTVGAYKQTKITPPTQQKPMPLFERVTFGKQNRVSWYVTYGQCVFSGRMQHWVRGRFGDAMKPHNSLMEAIEDVYSRVLDVQANTPTPF